ncbi:unnamed protein product [Brassica oleracea]|uniref:Uncharacterized protein n=1 Tax=Brassica oleracea var. oleracea TaxID=109376 RepID=A0A0D3AI65_BRAOL
MDPSTVTTTRSIGAMKDKQENIDIIETVFRGARKGRGLVIAPKDYSTKYRY